MGVSRNLPLVEVTKECLRRFEAWIDSGYKGECGDCPFRDPICNHDVPARWVFDYDGSEAEGSEPPRVEPADSADRTASGGYNHMGYYEDGRRYAPIDVIWDWGLDFDLGNVVKYISRYRRKDGIRIADLEKAKVYLEHEIAQHGEYGQYIHHAPTNRYGDGHEHTPVRFTPSALVLDWDLSVNLRHALKCVFQYQREGGRIDDLEAAMRCLNREIAQCGERTES